MLHLRAEYLEEGYSGGPVVDRDGALRGMITSDFGVSGTALDWSYLQQRLDQLEFPVNLRVIRVVRGNGYFLTSTINLYPGPGRHTDGRRFVPGGRVEAGLIFGIQEFSIGLARVSAGGASLSREEPLNAGDAFVAHYLTLGYKVRLRLDPLVSGTHTFSGGLMYFAPLEAWAVTTISGDSIDTKIGEPAAVRSVIRVTAVPQLTPHIGYRLFITEKLGLVAELFAFRPRYQEMRSDRIEYFLSIGIDTRSSTW
jgi:hypothetical protein